MANLTTSFANEIVDGLTGETPLTTPTTVYLALFTADPTEAGLVTNELSGSGYARVALTGKFPSASSKESVNDVDIDFVSASADWTEVTHIGFMKAGTAAVADMMAYSTADPATTTLNGEIFSLISTSTIVTVA